MPEKSPAEMTEEEFYAWILPRGTRRKKAEMPAENDDDFAGEIQVTPIMDLLRARMGERRRRPA